MNKNKKPVEKAKAFDAVRMMRDIREKLSVKYWKHPEVLKKEMEAIRKKYNLRLSATKANSIS